MRTIRGRNINEVYAVGIMELKHHGVLQPSQHGDTLEIPEPVSVMYDNPRERVLFNETRDINPFLHFFEALWIIKGRDDVEFLKFLVGNMAKYSDDGKTYYGAYGARMRQPHDQITEAVNRLKKNQNDRQVALTIRQGHDIFYTGKDQPCNMMLTCKIRNGKLNIHVFNRSNDFIWGLAGTNVVQFSMLQEYLAGLIGVEVGCYHQTTDSMHCYVNDQWEKLKAAEFPIADYYHHEFLDKGAVAPYDMMQGRKDDWHEDLTTFFYLFDLGEGGWKDIETNNFMTPFFNEVVAPMFRTFVDWKAYKATQKCAEALHKVVISANQVKAQDWGLVTTEWVLRRVANGS